MLLDKRKVSIITKIGSVVIALIFIASYIPFIFSPPSSQPTNAQQPTQQQIIQQIAALEKATKEDSSNASAWSQLGDAYFDQKAYDKAIANYGKALEINPKLVNSRVDMAIAYFYTGQAETATVEAKKAIEYNPDFPQAYYNLGIFLSSQGKVDEAIEAYEKFIKLDPKSDLVSQAKSQIEVLKKEKK